jgi:hypothetical protein
LLSIFQTKKAEYNKLILKSLVFGPKTTNQIAEYIYLNRKAQVKTKKVNKIEVKKVVSIISRKGSRLEELQERQYIKRENGLWHLTLKGSCVALTLFNDIDEFLPYAQTKLDLGFSDLAEKLHKLPFIETLISKEELNKMLNVVSPKWVLTVRECTNQLIKQGLDLDNIKEKEFQLILTAKLASYYTNVELFDKLESELRRGKS